MGTQEWLEVVGNPTVPRDPPARPTPKPAPADSRREKMFGVTRRAVTQRYLERLQRDRDKSKVIFDCVERLPITIRQMVYPQRPVMKDKDSWGTESGSMSSRDKFRLPAHADDEGWQRDVEEWMKGDYSVESSPRLPPPEHRSTTHCGGSVYSTPDRRCPDRRCPSQSTASAPAVVGSASNFVHHPGFQGTIGQMNNFKLKCDKKHKVLNVADANTSTQSHKPPFKPKGFGSLYDEMEFQRRYKKVFDLNKHIHFVHSNYVSGQKLVKRTKLPPIGHMSANQKDDPDSLDIFAIMSVQQYNHPDGGDGSRAPVSTPGDKEMETEASKISCYNCQHSPCPPLSHRNIEIPQSDSLLVGFLPGTIRTSGNSPFDGVKGSNMTTTSLPRSSNFRLLSFSKEGECETSRSMNDVHIQGSPSPRNKPKFDPDRYRKFAAHRKRVSRKQKDEENDSDDGEPFNISVKVEIKPKDTHSSRLSDGDDRDNSNSQDDLDIEGFKEKIIYATKFHNEVPTDARWYAGHGERPTAPRNTHRSTNHVPMRRAVSHADRFAPNKSFAELEQTNHKLQQHHVYLLNANPLTGMDLDERTKVLSPRSGSTVSSSRSIPEIRRTCPTPVTPVSVDAE